MRCPECGSHEIKSIRFEQICSSCGLIIDDRSLVADVTRFVRESACDPRIAVASGAAHDGRIVKSSWMLSRRERNMYQARRKIELFAGRLNLSKRIQDDALVLFSQVNQAGLLHGRGIEPFVAACIYHICMEQGYARTIVELSIQTGVPVKAIAGNFSLLRRHFKLRNYTVKTEELIPKYGSDLSLTPNVVSTAMEFCVKLDSKLPNIPPRTRAVTFLYMATKQSGVNIPQRIFSNATGVIERVIRKRSKQYAQFLSNSS